MKLSIVIPTLGRDTLEATLASCVQADELVVVLDTSRGGSLPCRLPDNAVFAEGSFGVTGGHAGRQLGIEMATGTHLAFFDDDDVYTPGAISLMKSAACARPVIFRMDHYAHGILWRDPVIRFGNVSTQMYVVPNDQSRFGNWTPHVLGIPEPGGDYTFIKETCEQMGEPVWREEVTSVLRPDPARLARYQTPSISVVTPWYNHEELWEAYSDAVLPELRDGDELLIVDNASEPPLRFALPLEPILPGANLGFSGGSNYGLEAARADAVLFLNNDITHTRRGWLSEIRDNLEPGVLVGRLRYDRHADVGSTALPYLDGWCLAGMRDDLRELGGFDESLAEPAYYSDNLLCLEARARGMTLRDVRVGLRHLENTTAGPSSDPVVRAATNANRMRYEARARELLTAV